MLLGTKTVTTVVTGVGDVVDERPDVALGETPVFRRNQRVSPVLLGNVGSVVLNPVFNNRTRFLLESDDAFAQGLVLEVRPRLGLVLDCEALFLGVKVLYVGL